VERPAGTELYVSLDPARRSLPPSMNVVMRDDAATGRVCQGRSSELGSGSGRRGFPSLRLLRNNGFGVRRIDFAGRDSWRSYLGAFFWPDWALLLAAIALYGVALLHGDGAQARDRHSDRPRCSSLPRAHADHETQGLQVTAMGVTIGPRGCAFLP